MRIDEGLVKEFSKCYHETEIKCATAIEQFNDFQSKIAVIHNFINSKIDPQKAKTSLLYFRFLQSIMSSQDLRVSIVTGSYKTVAEIIRYHFESLIQAFYVDQKHSNVSFECKMAVLSEISDKQDYFTNRLITRIKVDSNKSLERFYSDLNKMVHPSHADFPSVEAMLKEIIHYESRIRPEEFERVLIMTKQMSDCVLYLIFRGFPELKDLSNKDESVSEIVKASTDLPLLKNWLS